MIRKPPCLAAVFALSLLLFFAREAHGQHDPGEFFQGGYSEYDDPAQASYEAFYVPLGGDDIFTRMSDFNFSTVRYRRRGLPLEMNQRLLAGADLSGGLTSSIDFSLTSALRRARAGLVQATGTSYGWLGGTCDLYSSDPASMPLRHSLSFHATDRRGRAGARAYSAGKVSKGVDYAAMVYRRWGRDADIDGVFADELSFLAGAGIAVAEGHRINLMLTGAWSETGLRSAATQEAFDLTGDNLYNPSWGWFDGEERNSRVRERFQPLTLVSYEGRLWGHTTLDATVSYRFGRNAVSALAWFDAINPHPDYYRRMPSWIDDRSVAAEVTDLWRRRDPRVTQIDWNELHRRNATTGEGEAYIIENRIEEVGDAQFRLSLTTRVDDQTRLNYGAALRSERTSLYKEMKDRMGSAPMRDIDQYITEDRDRAQRWLNDVRNPDRLIDRGDRFGYDYRMAATAWSAWVSVSHTAGRLAVAGNAEVGCATMRRDGRYEKEIYPGDLSYGKSEKLSFDTYAVRASLRYSFSPRHILSAAGVAAAAAPQSGDVFVSPRYTNMTVDGADSRKVLGGELSYALTLPAFRAKATLYAVKTGDEGRVYNYFDDIGPVAGGDISPAYSDMILTGIDRVFYGLELGATYELSPRFSLDLAAAAGRYEYASDPSVTILEEMTLTPYVEGARSYLDGYRVGGTPETALSACLRYGDRNWIASLTYNYMGGRYVEPNPLRRTERIYNLAGSQERFSQFVAQERLGDVHTLDIFVMRSFRIKGAGTLSLLLSVNNLLNAEETVYGGYEQMRIARHGTGSGRTYEPFPSKYTYSKGRTWYASISYTF